MIDILFRILSFCFYEFMILLLHHVLLYMLRHQPQLQPYLQFVLSSTFRMLIVLQIFLMNTSDVLLLF